MLLRDPPHTPPSAAIRGCVRRPRPGGRRRRARGPRRRAAEPRCSESRSASRRAHRGGGREHGLFRVIEDAHAEDGLSPDVGLGRSLTRPQIHLHPRRQRRLRQRAAARRTSWRRPSGRRAAPIRLRRLQLRRTQAPDAAGRGAATRSPPSSRRPGARRAATADLLHDQRLTLSDSAAPRDWPTRPAATSKILASLVRATRSSWARSCRTASFIIAMVDALRSGPQHPARDLAQELAALDRHQADRDRHALVADDGKRASQREPVYTGDEHEHHILIGYGEPPPSGAGASRRRPRPSRRPRPRWCPLLP